MSMNLARIVTISGWAAAAFGALGFAASLGRGPLPELPAGAVVPLHAVLLALGCAAAVAAARRGEEIDRERFDYAADPHATRDEIKEAHREAERRHKVTFTALVAAPLLLGYWLAYELPAGLALGRALPAAPLVGFGLGVLLARLRRG
jgi:hypothetical protein